MNAVKASQAHTMTNPAPTERQGQFLAYIHQYGIVNGYQLGGLACFGVGFRSLAHCGFGDSRCRLAEY